MFNEKENGWKYKISHKTPHALQDDNDSIVTIMPIHSY